MGDMLEWFLLDGDWYDRKQKREIDELRSGQARSASRLRGQLEKSNASVSSRLDRLERAFAAIVELEDVRAELIHHERDAAVRRFARAVMLDIDAFGATVQPGQRPPCPENPGYWLTSAATWAARLVDDGVDDSELLAVARLQNAQRADLFAALLAAVIGRPEVAAAPAARLIDSEWVVNEWQRTLWPHVARGRFGPTARGLLVDALRRATTDVEGQRIRTAVLGSAASDQHGAAAARSLERLAAAVGPAPAGATVDDPAMVGQDDSLTELLVVVLAEGAPGEVDVLDRMSEVRRVLATSSMVPPPERRSIDAVADDPASLVLADINGGDRALHRLAIDVVAPELRRWADELRESAAIPTANEVDVKVAGGTIAVGADGVGDEVWVPLVDAAHRTPEPGGVSMVLAGGVVVAVLGLVMMFVVPAVGWLVAVVGLGAAAFGGRRMLLARAAAQEATRRRDAELVASRKRIDSARSTAAASDAEAARLAERVPEHHAAVASGLAANDVVSG